MFYKFFHFHSFELESFRSELEDYSIQPDGRYFLYLYYRSGERFGFPIPFSLNHPYDRNHLIENLYQKISILINFEVLGSSSLEDQEKGFYVVISESWLVESSLALKDS